MEQQQAIQTLINAFDQLRILHDKYKCKEGTIRIGNYARILLEGENVKMAIKTLRS